MLRGVSLHQSSTPPFHRRAPLCLRRSSVPLCRSSVPLLQSSMTRCKSMPRLHPNAALLKGGPCSLPRAMPCAAGTGAFAEGRRAEWCARAAARYPAQKCVLWSEARGRRRVGWLARGAARPCK
eukprot:1145804-Pelagomonas_calceolata.AAC.1